MAKWIDQIMQSENRIAVPIMTHPGIEEIGKRVIDAVTDGETHYQAIKALADKYETGACTVIMDLTVEAEAFGCQIGFAEDEVPNVVNRLVYDSASIEALPIPEMTQGRLPEYLKANKLAVENITDRPVLAGCIGPYSLAGRLYDMSEIMVAIYIEPDTIHVLLEKCTAFILDYCRELKRIGVQGVIMAEPAAGLLSNEDCQAFSTDYVRRIVDALQDDGFSIVLHNCGNKGQCTQAMIASGAAGLHFGNAIDMQEALEECLSDVLVMGNLDPVGIFKQATPEAVYSATTALLRETRKYKNFVISSGCDIPPHTPDSNIQAFFEAVNRYNLSYKS